MAILRRIGAVTAAVVLGSAVAASAAHADRGPAVGDHGTPGSSRLDQQTVRV
jgi:hypothetical protein